ncbi:MAG TPA: GPP34 family phosphoprotein [Stellaceae bacterium]|nr:GPP34 family phosphoprotein [Stellaceae bacterium]
MLGFVEEMVLLQLDETQGGFAELPQAAADIVLAGAAMMELALQNRVDADLERLFVVDGGPTGDAMLDDALALLGEAGAPTTATAAIERVTANVDDYRREALRRLVAKGVLREENGRHFWVFRTRRYPVIDDREQREVRARLRQLVLSDDIPDPRDVVLICLVEACGLLGLVLSPDEIAASKTRVAELSRLDLIGQAVTRAVAEIRFMIRHAAAPVY